MSLRRSPTVAPPSPPPAPPSYCSPYHSPYCTLVLPLHPPPPPLLLFPRPLTRLSSLPRAPPLSPLWAQDVRGEADAARARLAEALAGKEAAERRARDLEGQIMRIKTEEVATLPPSPLVLSGHAPPPLPPSY